jgi:hypothetical protein
MAGVTSRRVLISRWAYAVLSLLFLVGILLQVLWAGLAVMSDPAYWETHVNFVHAIEVLPLLMLIAALLSRSGHVLWILAVVGFLFIGAQYATVEVRPDLVAGLHPVIALLLFGVALEASRQGLRAAIEATPFAKPPEKRSVPRAATTPRISKRI